MNKLKLLLFAACVFGCESQLPTELRTETAAEIEAAEALADTMANNWRNAMAQRRSLRPTARKCEQDIVPNMFLFGDDATAERLLGDVKSKNYNVEFYSDPIAEDARSPLSKKAKREIDSIAYYLRPDTRYEPDLEPYVLETVARSAELADPGFWSQDVAIVIENESAAVVETDTRGLPKTTVESDPFFTRSKTGFTPGTLSGKAYLFDYPSNSIVCVGTFSAANSTNIKRFSRGSGMKWTLKDDLRGRAVMSALRSLRVAR